jgi:hypothetical protein
MPPLPDDDSFGCEEPVPPQSDRDLAAATVGTAYDAPIEFHRGFSAIRIDVIEGELPLGLEIVDVGTGFAVQGTPTAAGESLAKLEATAQYIECGERSTAFLVRIDVVE